MSAGLNLEKLNTNLSGTNNIWAAFFKFGLWIYKTKKTKFDQDATK